MNILFKILFLFVCFSFLSCEKNTKENIDFNVDLKITDLICYPDDIIHISFLISPANGIAPYTFKWISPDTLDGSGPFDLDIKSNLYLHAEVCDADSNKIDFQYELLKDTIDFLLYDYRNRFTGLYLCNVKYNSTENNSVGEFITTTTFYKDTIEISKPADISMLNISNFPVVSFNYKSLSFEAYHTSGRFIGDSCIHIYYFMTPVGSFNWTYDGKKLK